MDDFSFVLGRPLMQGSKAIGYSLEAIKGNFLRDANPSNLAPNPDQMKSPAQGAAIHAWRDIDRTRIRYDWLASLKKLSITVKLGKGKTTDTIDFFWNKSLFGPPWVARSDANIIKVSYDQISGLGVISVRGNAKIELISQG